MHVEYRPESLPSDSVPKKSPADTPPTKGLKSILEEGGSMVEKAHGSCHSYTMADTVGAVPEMGFLTAMGQVVLI